MKRLIGIIALLAAAMVQTSLAADWYVSWTGGNDNNSGSFSSPWRTMSYALRQGSRIRPGDTIWLRAGTYVETITLDNGTVANGTPDSLITVRAYENAGNVETVILQGSLRVYANNGGADYGINHRYMNFRITGSNTDAYRFTGDNASAVTEFINMEIDHNHCSGLYFGYGTQSFGTIRVINTKIHDNPPGHINGSSEGNSGIILSSRGHFEIEDCQIYENGDRTFHSYENKGINVQNQPGYTGHVKRTSIYNNVETGMDCPLVNGLIEDCIFYYNGMMDTVEVGPGNENGDSNLSMQSNGGGNTIRRCLFYNSGRYSLNIMNDNNIVYNCTIVDTLPYEKQSIQEDRAPLYLDPNSAGNIIKNCVIANYVPYVPGSDPDLYLAVLGGMGSGNSYLENHLDNNEYYAPHHPTGKFIKIAGMGSYNLAELRAAFPTSGSDVHSISNNPLFVNQNLYNYQITNGSPCVNAGTTQISANITIPAPEYNGNAPDMGYWETGTPVVNTPPWIDPIVPNCMTQQNAAITFDLTAYEHDYEQSASELIWSESGLDPSLASASINPTTDVLTITPVNNATGSDIFTLILSDGQGGLDSQSVTLTVTPPNDPPWIEPIIPNFVTHEDSTITFSLTPYEHDSEQTPAQLNWSVSGLNATLATANINSATDLLTLIPVANQNGSDVFTLILSDGLGGLDSQSVTLTVTPVNDSPWINPVIPDLSTEVNATQSVSLSQYEHDIEQTPAQLTWSVSGLNSALASASINQSTDLLTIVPVPDQTGSDVFTLFLSDGQGGLDSQSVTLDVNAIIPASNWYVSPTGNDNNNGTFGSPWRTLTYALQQGNRVMPGDTLWMRAGTYVENVTLDNGTVANGTPDHLITIRAYQSGSTIETVVLQGSIRVYANNGGADYGINHRYMNFRITGSNTDAYRFTGDNASAVTEFINMEIDHNHCSGLYFGYGTQSFGTIRVINTKIHDNPPGHINGSSEGNSGIILSSRGHFEIEDCQIYENGDRTFHSYENKGINVQNQPGYTGHVKRTSIYNNVETGMDCPLVNGLIEDCIFYYNGMMDTVEVGPGNENGDSNLSMQSNGGGNTIRRCLFYNSGRYSLNIMNDNNIVYNCTIVDTLPYEKQSVQEDRAPLYLDPNSAGNIIKNCVIANYVPYVPGSDPDLYLAVLGGMGSGNSYLENHLDNNEYYAPHHPTGKFIKIAGMGSYNLAELRAAFPTSGSDVHSISNNPLFVNQNLYNYQITNGSPCINAGTTQISANITIPAPEYNGNAPDMGYWETGTAPSNSPPYIDPTIPNLSTPEDVVLTFDLTPYEHDLEQPGAQLTWSASGLNPTLATATIIAATDVITLTPVANANGSDVFTLILSDGAGGLDSQSVTLTITGVNDPPYIDPVVPNFATVEDSTITFDLTPYEHDLEQPGAQLTWSASGLNPTLATATIIAATDVITLTPVANANGSDVFTLILSDGAGGLDSQSVTLTITGVNDPPYIDPTIPNLSTPEDVVLTFDLTPYEHDLEQPGAQLTWSASGLNPTLATATINAATDVITLTPVANANGSDVFTLILSDGAGGLDSQSVTLTITGVNDPPYIDPVVPNFATVEDSTITFDLTPYEHDLEQPGAQLTWSASGLNPTLATATIIAATDMITLTPVANANGSDVFTLILSDGAGGLDSQSVTLTITGVNDPPYIDPTIPNLSTPEDVVLTFDLTPYEHDLEQPGAQLTWSASGLNPTLATATINAATDVITLTPVANANGSDVFTLILSDGAGGLDSQSVTLTITGVNDPPYIDPVVPNFATVEDSTITFDLTSYEHDLEQPGAQLTWSASGLNPTLATATIIASTDVITLTPVANANGSDVFTLILSDGAGGLDSQSVTLTISPEGNNAPEIHPEVPDGFTKEDQPLSLDLSEYATDPDLGDQLTWSISGANPQMIIALVDTNTSQLTIQPLLNTNGIDTLLLTLRDQGGLTDTQNWIINVVAINDTPWIQPPVPDSSVIGPDAMTISLVSYGHDVEDPPQNLMWGISQVDPALFTAIIDNMTKSLILTPTQFDTAGTDTMLLTLTDTGGLSDTQELVIERVGFMETTLHRAGPHIGRVPDVTILPGETPHPIDLRSYMVLGAEPFKRLIFDTEVLRDTVGMVQRSPMIKVLVREGKLVIIPPAGDWMGSSLVCITVTDHHKKSDRDTIRVTISPESQQDRSPGQGNLEIWQLAETSQTLHADTFYVHPTNLILPDGFACFQIQGGQYLAWQDAEDLTELAFPLVSNSPNQLSVRMRYTDGRIGSIKQLTVNEDSTPPAAPTGLKLKTSQQKVASKK